MSLYYSTQLLEGARNCVVTCGQATEGTNVLILNLANDKANPVDDLAVGALVSVCHEVGAHPQVVWATGMARGWWDSPSPIVMGAFERADLVINNTISIGRPLKPVREAMFRKGITMIRNMATTVDLLSSEWARFPFEISDEITKRVGERFDAGTSWRVVHPDGTDITGRIGAPATLGTGHKKYGEYRRQGHNRPFPQGCFNPLNVEDAEGVLVFDRTLPWEARHIGVPERRFSEPIRVTVEKNHMVHFEGGPEADAYRHFYEELQPHLGDDALNVSGWHCGIHPKAKIYLSADENPDVWHRGVHNHPSVLHFHLGGSLAREYDYAYMWHLSNELDGSTVYIDGEKLYDQGYLTVLDDPEVRRVAQEFGDPDMLLRPVALEG